MLFAVYEHRSDYLKSKNGMLHEVFSSASEAKNLIEEYRRRGFKALSELYIVQLDPVYNSEDPHIPECLEV